MRRTAPGLVVGVLGVVGLALFVLPLVGLLLRAPLERLGEVLTGERTATALRLSLVTSFSALGLSTVLGVPLAFLLARGRVPARRLVRALVTLPMVLPPVVGGVALLFVLGRRGFVGRLLDEALGVTLPFTVAGTVLAEAFVAMPFLVVTVEAGIRSLDARLEQAAATLGASPVTVGRRVTLPLLAPSLAAGMALCWARALGEFGATITFAGNFPGRTQTIPLAVYLELQRDTDAAVLLSLVLLAVSIGVLVAFRDRYLAT